MNATSDIRQLAEADLDRFIAIAGNAYPAFPLNTDEERQRFKTQLISQDADPTIDLYGLWRDGDLQGGMILYDFTMTLYETPVLAGGVGMVAVDLLHKKEKIARDLVVAFLRRYRERGASLALLYPFRPDFYKAMGFGFGTKMNGYRIRPGALPNRGAKEHLRMLGPEDRQLRAECYARFARRTHGMIEHSHLDITRMFTNPKVHVVGFQPGSELRGYLAFRFEPVEGGSFLRNDIVVSELIYETPGALLALLAFLRAQADQINLIQINTQDPDFHHLLDDPRDNTDRLLPSVYHESNTQGVGLMYRVINCRRLFEDLANHRFGAETCTVTLTLRDTLLPEHDGSITVHFADGHAQVSADQAMAADVEVALDIASFSSLIMGCIDFERLVTYGLATVSETRHVGILSRLFHAPRQPMCTTLF